MHLPLRGSTTRLRLLLERGDRSHHLSERSGSFKAGDEILVFARCGMANERLTQFKRASYTRGVAPFVIWITGEMLGGRLTGRRRTAKAGRCSEGF